MEEEGGEACGAWPGPPTVAAADAGVAGPPVLPSNECGAPTAAAEEAASATPLAVGTLPAPPTGSSSGGVEGGEAGFAAHAVVSVLGSLADRLANDAAARDASLIAEQMLLLQVRTVDVAQRQSACSCESLYHQRLPSTPAVSARLYHDDASPAAGPHCGRCGRRWHEQWRRQGCRPTSARRLPCHHRAAARLSCILRRHRCCRRRGLCRLCGCGYGPAWRL